MLRAPLLFLSAFLPLAAAAQTPDGWQACAGVPVDAQRLACFDAWAKGQRPPSTDAVAPTFPAPVPAARPLRLTTTEGCRDPRFSTLSRFWELETGSDCGTFGVRSYRPLVASAAVGDTVNRQPTSENPANNPATAVDYHPREMRLQFSFRSKLAQDLLAPAGSGLSDSLWFAYSQQSYWQLFTPGISRPFRSTDHEPEVMYVYPFSANLGGWQLRYGGIGVVHHSNGQSLPYSRSWNRAYVMAGAERGGFQLQGRVWRRLDEDRVNDDNPNISDYYGRAELQANWRPNDRHMLRATARHNLRSSARGSLRLEWFRTLWSDRDPADGGLQLHVQLFTGYGDTLLDYNRKRTVLTFGLSLAEW